MKKTFLNLLMVIFTLNAFAQQSSKISGKITDASSKAIVGASVRLLNTSIGSVTDQNGAFTLSNVSSGSLTLQVSANGYADFSRPVNSSSATAPLNIQLQLSPKMLDKVVVTAQKTEELLQQIPASITAVSSKQVEEYLRAKSSETYTQFRFIHYHFDGHFANMKNALTEACLGDYIFQIDADEMPNLYLMQYLPVILENNKVDVLRVPRVNTVKGITQEHIQKWGWIVDNHGRVNWPDLQWRIYKNNGEIKWKNKVHETLDNYKTHAILPLEIEFALEHHKDIERQEKQNAYYSTL